MALSNSVKESLQEAEAALKNALSFAARNEQPYVSVIIAEMVQKLDLLIKTDKMTDKLEEQLKKKGIDGNTFFGGLF